MILDVASVPRNVSCLEPYVAAGVLGATEVHLASFVLGQLAIDDDHLATAIAAATWAMLNGHDCADVRRLEAVVEQWRRRVGTDMADQAVPAIEWPDPDDWLGHLAAPSLSPAVRLAESPDEVIDGRPLVVSGDRLYLQRAWVDECLIARVVGGLAVDVAVGPAVSELLERLLPAVDPNSDSPNRQRIAADTVLRSRIAIIAGGPGTGKTYSVARVLAALVEDGLAQHSRLPSVALVAPTGKAAQRLSETIADAVEAMAGIVSEQTIDHIASVAPTTIHRLLGAQGTTGRFRHDARSPLHHEIVIVDETSMASLPLMARLADALRPTSRLVLVGDPGQLESVQEGAILGDLVAAGSTHDPRHPLAGRVVELTENHRFGGSSPIHTLATLVRTDGPVVATADRQVDLTAFLADADSFDVTVDGSSSTVRFVENDDVLSASVVSRVRSLVEPSLRRMRDAAELGDVTAALDALAEVRILCAHRRGPAGATTWNRLAEAWMRGPQSGRGEWYPGRPVLITRNDERLGLSNGDSGVVVKLDRRAGQRDDQGDGDRIVVAFPRTKKPPLLLPTFALADIDTCFAMTVHKSQGSEYPSVALILPPAGSPLIGRELAYTGITRARNHLLVVGSGAVLAQCAATPADRMTGLAEALGAR